VQVSAEIELERVRPVLAAAVGLGCPISIDTTKPEVMRVALDLGADIVNDIAALRTPGALAAVASHPNCGVSLMHMRGTPRSMRTPVDRAALEAASIAAMLLAVQRGAAIVRVHDVAAAVAALAVCQAAKPAIR
jgi:dihydropteroate synthase